MKYLLNPLGGLRCRDGQANSLATSPIKKKLAEFGRDEDGAIIAMTMFIFLFMMVMAGLGIDTMRHEMERAKLQSVLDSAVLAGAKAPVGEDPEAIVKDYFAKANMSKYLNGFKDGDIQKTMTHSKVAASASMTMDTYLMKLSGVQQLTAKAGATAETRVPNLEVAMVLDVSGSMAGEKIVALRKAAKEFTTTILASGDPGAISISLVPFSTSVTPTDSIFEALLVDEEHDYSGCLVFDDADFGGTALVTKAEAIDAAEQDITLVPMEQDIYTSRYGGFENFDPTWRSCMTEEGFRVRPFSTNETDLHTNIDALPAMGNTSGDMGIKWGAALLDPSFRDVTDALIDKQVVPAAMAQTPVDYTAGDTLKVIVMMGDGENTTTNYFPQDSKYRGDLSDLFHVEYMVEVLDYAYPIWNKNARYFGPQYEYLCDSKFWRCVYQPEGQLKSAFFLRDPEWTYGPGLLTTVETATLEVLAEAGPPCVPLLENYFNGLPKSDTGAWENHNCGAAVPKVLDALLDDWYYFDIKNNKWLNGAEFIGLRQTLTGFQWRRQLSWEDAWGMLTPEAYGNITGIWSAYNEYISNGVTGAEKDTRMDSVCTAAKDNGVVIYTIGYMVPENGLAEQSLKKCATGYDAAENASPYYFDVNDVDISKAFSSIAGNVKTLRLTQ